MQLAGYLIALHSVFTGTVWIQDGLHRNLQLLAQLNQGICCHRHHAAPRAKLLVGGASMLLTVQNIAESALYCRSVYASWLFLGSCGFDSEVLLATKLPVP
jgi:hypothetical protein